MLLNRQSFCTNNFTCLTQPVRLLYIFSSLYYILSFLDEELAIHLCLIISCDDLNQIAIYKFLDIPYNCKNKRRKAIENIIKPRLHDYWMFNVAQYWVTNCLIFIAKIINLAGLFTKIKNIWWNDYGNFCLQGNVTKFLQKFLTENQL